MIRLLVIIGIALPLMACEDAIKYLTVRDRFTVIKPGSEHFNCGSVADIPRPDPNTATNKEAGNLLVDLYKVAENCSKANREIEEFLNDEAKRLKEQESTEAE